MCVCVCLCVCLKPVFFIAKLLLKEKGKNISRCRHDDTYLLCLLAIDRKKYKAEKLRKGKKTRNKVKELKEKEENL